MCGQGVEVQTEWSFFMGMGDQDDYFLRERGGGGVKEFGGEVLDYTNCPFNCVFREWG